MSYGLLLLVLFGFLVLAAFAGEGKGEGAGDAAATATADPPETGDGQGDETDSVQVGDRKLPPVLPEGGLSGLAQGKPPRQPPAAKPKGDEKADDDADDEGDEKTEDATTLDPRLVQAAKRVGVSEARLSEWVEKYGKEDVEGMLKIHADALDEHSKRLGEAGREDDDEETHETDETSASFTFTQDVREAYGEENKDLLDAIESGINAHTTGAMERVATLEGLVMRQIAHQVIASAGDLAKDLKIEALLDKAEQFAAGAALKGKTLHLDEAFAEALKILTTDKAAEAARKKVKKAMTKRADQVSGPPAGRTKPPAGPQERKQQAFANIEKARLDAGLPPSPPKHS